MDLAHQSSRPYCSVVVPCRGDGHVLGRCLESLFEQKASFQFEVIVVESSQDPAIEGLLKVWPRARLVRSPVGLLPGAARNLGAGEARGDIIAFTDADCVQDKDWLSTAAEALNRGAKLVGGSVGNSLPFHPIAVVDNLMQCLEFLPGRPEGPVAALPGANLAIRKHDFEDLLGFREDLPAGEDSLFVERAAKRWPGEVIFNPRMRVRHRGRTTLSDFWKHQKRFGYHRGANELRLRPGYRERGRHPSFVTYFCARRYVFFLWRVLQWKTLGLPGFLMLSPLIAVGLMAYGKGFMAGCRESGAGNEASTVAERFQGTHS